MYGGAELYIIALSLPPLLHHIYGSINIILDVSKHLLNYSLPCMRVRIIAVNGRRQLRAPSRSSLWDMDFFIFMIQSAFRPHRITTFEGGRVLKCLVNLNHLNCF